MPLPIALYDWNPDFLKVLLPGERDPGDAAPFRWRGLASADTAYDVGDLIYCEDGDDGGIRPMIMTEPYTPPLTR